jgi:hypothetical protein
MLKRVRQISNYMNLLQSADYKNLFGRLGKEFEGVTECLENTVCNSTETDAERSLVNYDREKCVYHPTTDG